MDAKIKALEARLNLNSSNSGNPPLLMDMLVKTGKNLKIQVRVKNLAVNRDIRGKRYDRAQTRSY
jgi:hypothetical protein